MTTKEYIESGNLEAFVLGALTPQEEAQVLADIARYPELAKEVAAIEEALLNYAASEAMVPHVHLKDKIWDSIQSSVKKEANNNVELPPVVNNAGIGSNNINKTMPLSPLVRDTQWRYAAIWVALAGSVALNGIFWLQNSKQKQQFTAQAVQLDKIVEEQKSLAQVVDNYKKNKEMMSDTGMQTIVMHTIVKGHPMAATLYWHKEKSEAYVMIDGLPKPPKGMQYQLWVIQAGKPVDMGMMPVDMAGTANIQKVVKQVASGEAFAISLEKAGGSPTPTAENIYVLGKTS